MKKLTELSAKEKLNLLCGKDCWHTDDLDGKIPQLFVSDGPVGLRTERTGKNGKSENIPAVAFPSIQVLANTWSEKCAKKMGNALADEAHDRGVDILLAPGVNIKRNPLNGRNFEYFSEDPFLAGTLAKNYIEGVQECGIGVCLKHFCCNNLEYDRHHQTSDVDERTLRELYYVPFEIACEAKPVSVMCSYNRINGTPAAEYKKGYEFLRGECGFDGAIVSDWGAVIDRTASAKAGLDLSMPAQKNHNEKLFADYEAGNITDEEVDACAERVLSLIYRCKAMQEGKGAKTAESERVACAKEVAAEGAVLLKNDGVLPLKGIKKVSVCGCFAKPDTIEMLRGGGSAGVEWLDKTFDVPQELAKRGFDVSYESAFRYAGVEFRQNSRQAILNAAKSDVNVVCVGTGNAFEYEGGDRATMRLPDVQERAILETAKSNKNTVVVVFAGAAIDMSAWADKVAAILFVGFPGMGGDAVIADILVGKINPSGKLSETIPTDIESIPAANVFRCAGVTRYQEGLDVGYRYFDTYEEPVLFPFGHGLSYSKFLYKDAKAVADGETLRLTYAIENVSGVDGKEVSQVYVRECAPTVYRPFKELKGFAKTEVKAGKSEKVQVELGSRAFAHWSVSKDRWEITEGVYEILVGASVEDIHLKVLVAYEKGALRVL